jgi:uncharacterized protein YndB with AHSA1/START domain
MSTDRIEKQILLRAPIARVWHALTDAVQFGTWFLVRLEAPFAIGRTVAGQVTHPGYEHVRFEATVESMETERRFAFRWHPNAVDPKVDYSKEPTTLVEFTLEARGNDTLLTVVESGFDRLPLSRRSEAFLRNSEGWTAQLENIRRHVAA